MGINWGGVLKGALKFATILPQLIAPTQAIVEDLKGPGNGPEKAAAVARLVTQTAASLDPQLGPALMAHPKVIAAWKIANDAQVALVNTIAEVETALTAQQPPPPVG